MRDHVVFFLNGERHEVRGDASAQTLADYLRYHLGLTGTKIVCAEGDCGACTVLRRFPFAAKAKGAKRDSRTRFLAVNSCVALVAQMDGSSLVTIDALAKDGRLTPVQKAMMKCHGSQCGFCTPGFVMALTGACEKMRTSKRPSDDQRLSPQSARNILTGNLCRCTGYQQIIEAAVSVDMSSYEPLATRFHSRAQEKSLLEACDEPVHIKTDTFEFYGPRTLKEAARFLGRNKDARILGAATDLGVLHNKRRARISRVLSLHLISELYEIHDTRRGGQPGDVRFGSRVTLGEARGHLKSRAPELARYLDIFASPQIKNIATLAGNVANASPIADTPPALIAADAVVHTFGPKGPRAISISDFFLGYRKTALKPGEMITAIAFKAPSKNERLAAYKVSERKDLDISSVNAAFWVRFEGRGSRRRIIDARVAYGGVAATPLRLRKIENTLIDKTIDSLDMELAAQALQSEISPISDVRGSAAFRRILAENLLRRFFKDLAQERA